MRKPRAFFGWVEIATLVVAVVLWASALAPVGVPASGAASVPAAAAKPGATLPPRVATPGVATPGVATPGVATPASVALATKRSFEHWSRRPESDVVAEPYGLSIEALRALRPGQRLTLPDPEGGAIDLDVVAREPAGAFERIRLSHDDLPSTVTLNATTFHATIATARGAYAVSNDGGETLLVRHAVLDRRTVPDARDYIASPRS